MQAAMETIILELSWADGDEIAWTVGDLKKTFKSSDPAATMALKVGDQLCDDLGYLKPYLVAYKEAIHEAAFEQGQTETETFPALCVELVDKTLEALKEDKNEDAPPGTRAASKEGGSVTLRDTHGWGRQTRPRILDAEVEGGHRPPHTHTLTTIGNNRPTR